MNSSSTNFAFFLIYINQILFDALPFAASYKDLKEFPNTRAHNYAKKFCRKDIFYLVFQLLLYLYRFIPWTIFSIKIAVWPTEHSFHLIKTKHARLC